jgi:hypothetical protein
MSRKAHVVNSSMTDELNNQGCIVRQPDCVNKKEKTPTRFYLKGLSKMQAAEGCLLNSAIFF